MERAVLRWMKPRPISGRPWRSACWVSTWTALHVFSNSQPCSRRGPRCVLRHMRPRHFHGPCYEKWCVLCCCDPWRTTLQHWHPKGWRNPPGHQRLCSPPSPMRPGFYRCPARGRDVWKAKGPPNWPCHGWHASTRQMLPIGDSGKNSWGSLTTP